MYNIRKIACRHGDLCIDQLRCGYSHTARTETLILCPNVTCCKLGPLCPYSHGVAAFDCSICITKGVLLRNSTKLFSVPMNCNHHFCSECLQSWKDNPLSLVEPNLFSCPYCHVPSEHYIVGTKTSYSPTEKQRLRSRRIPDEHGAIRA